MSNYGQMPGAPKHNPDGAMTGARDLEKIGVELSDTLTTFVRADLEARERDIRMLDQEIELHGGVARVRRFGPDGLAKRRDDLARTFNAKVARLRAAIEHARTYG